MIEQFEKGDYDIITHTHKEDTKEKKVNRIKEKGIVIKVKKLETEELSEEIKEGKDSEPVLSIIESVKDNKKKEVKTNNAPFDNKNIEYASQYEDDIEPLI